MDIENAVYKKAFDAYLRRGTPIYLSLKHAEESDQYVWLTRLDDKVRDSHAANHGKIFAWKNPPAAGHPGGDYGCRCVAVPYKRDLPEDLAIELQDVADTGTQWTSLDFINHYFFGEGAPVTLRETGHLEAIVANYRRLVIDDPTVLPDQIVKDARSNIGSSFQNDFGRPYYMTDIVFSVGNTTIGGVYRGSSHAIGGMLYLAGAIDFYLRDSFRDPLDIEEATRQLEKVNAIIAEEVSRLTAGLADLPRHIEKIVDDLARQIDGSERRWRDYIRDRVLLEISRQNKSGEVFERKELGELPFSTAYDIVDKWSGIFSGRILVDGSRSRYG